MPRQWRIEYPGAIYHVMNRGDRREPIFEDDADRKRFVTTLGEVPKSGRGFRPGNHIGYSPEGTALKCGVNASAQNLICAPII